jgi:hypothetical protein
MKWLIVSLMLVGISGVAQDKGGAPLRVSDNFNDGVRNRSIWRTGAYTPTTKLVETGTRLFFTTGDINPYDSTYATWRMKSSRVLVDSDVLETSALFNVPFYSSADPGAVVRLGLLWADPAVPQNTINFAVEMTPLFRYLEIIYGGTGGSGGVQKYTFPVNTRNIYLKLRYSNVTKKTTFWWRRPGEAVWNRLPFNINLTDLWSIPLNTVIVRSDLLAECEGFWIQPSHNMYFDNFQVVQTIP